MIEKSITVDENHPLEIGIALYNLDYTAANAGQSAPDNAFGLHNGTEGEDGKPLVTWTSTTDLATKLTVPYVDGMEFTSPYLLTPDKEALETVGGSGSAPETEAATETETTLVTEAETVVETTAQTAAPETSANTAAPETDAPATEGGCASVVGIGAVSVMAIAAAAVVIKRKEQ